MTRPFALVALLAAAGGPRAAEAPVAPPSDPPGAPLELRLVMDDLPVLDPRGDSLETYRRKIVEAEKAGEPLPASVCGLKVVIVNTGKSAVKVWVAGDATLLNLDLQGTGAMTAESRPARMFIP